MKFHKEPSFCRCFFQEDWVERSRIKKENLVGFDTFVFSFKVKAERSSGDFWEM